MEAALNAPAHGKKYDIPVYERLLAKLQSKANRLGSNWTVKQVEMALFAAKLSTIVKITGGPTGDQSDDSDSKQASTISSSNANLSEVKSKQGKVKKTVSKGSQTKPVVISSPAKRSSSSGRKRKTRTESKAQVGEANDSNTSMDTPETTVTQGLRRSSRKKSRTKN